MERTFNLKAGFAGRDDVGAPGQLALGCKCWVVLMGMILLAAGPDVFRRRIPPEGFERTRGSGH
jgi:hypothetical protein